MNRLKLLLLMLILHSTVQSAQLPESIAQKEFSAVTAAVMIPSLFIGGVIAPGVFGYSLVDSYIVPKIQKHFYKELYVLEELKKEIKDFSDSSRCFIKSIDENNSFLEIFGQTEQKQRLFKNIIAYKTAYKEECKNVHRNNNKTEQEIADIKKEYEKAKATLLQNIEDMNKQLKNPAPAWLPWLPTISAAFTTALFLYLSYPNSKFRNVSSFLDLINVLGRLYKSGTV